MEYIKYHRLLLIIILLSLIISACNLGKFQNNDLGNDIVQSDEINHVDTMDKGPVKGGTLKLFSTYVDTFNPIRTKNTYMHKYTSLIYESMVKLNKNQYPTPWLSDSWEVSQDGYRWYFNIRPGVMWQDGFPLTAFDMEFTMEKIMEAGAESIYSFNLSNITSFTALSNNILEVVLKKPNSFTAEQMTFPIIPKRVNNKQNNGTLYSDKFPPGTGAYSIKSYEENKKIKLTLSRSWWYKKINDKEDIPYIADIEINLFKYSKEMLNAFQMKAIDVINIENNQLSKYINKPHVVFKTYPDNIFDFLAINLSHPALKDKDVRQSIALAIDKNRIIDRIMPGMAVASDLPVTPESWIYKDVDPSLESAEDNNYIGKDIDPDLDTNTNSDIDTDPEPDINIDTDTDTDTDTGVNIKTNKNIEVPIPLNMEILVNEENEVRIKVAEEIKECLAEIGITININKVKWSDMLRLIQEKKYSLALIGCTIPPYPDLSFLFSNPYLPYYYSDNQIVTNIAGYNNENVNNLICKIFLENDSKEKISLFRQIKDILNNEVPYIGLYFYNGGVFYNSNVRGCLEPHLWNEYNDINRWYIIE